ncbi:MAG TPA: LEA type 2 family protein [Segetibacter sp.]|nr:LEA type 2 family protein [Segetibacter sp.]
MNSYSGKESDRRGRKWLIALAIVALLVVGFWLWWRSPNSSIKEGAGRLVPELSVASLNITDIDQNKISATSNIILRNNLPVEVKTNRLDYVIYIDSAKVIEDSYSKPVTIRSSDTTSIRLPMEIMFRNMAAVLKRFEDKNIDSADYSMKATFQVDVPVAGERNFTMNFSKRLPALRLLKAKMGNIDIGKLGFKESSLDMTVNVQNPNAFPIKMKDGKYKLSIDNDANVMEGVMEKVVNIPAHGTAPVSMHVDMKTMKIPELGWKMLFDKKDTRFKLNFSGKLMSENGMLNNSNMAFNMDGTLDELTDMAK